MAVSSTIGLLFGSPPFGELALGTGGSRGYSGTTAGTGTITDFTSYSVSHSVGNTWLSASPKLERKTKCSNCGAGRTSAYDDACSYCQTMYE